jgi:hypothetical protein
MKVYEGKLVWWQRPDTLFTFEGYRLQNENPLVRHSIDGILGQLISGAVVTDGGNEYRYGPRVRITVEVLDGEDTSVQE